MSRKELEDTGLAALLELHGEIFPMENGFWNDVKRIIEDD